MLKPDASHKEANYAISLFHFVALCFIAVHKHCVVTNRRLLATLPQENLMATFFQKRLLRLSFLVTFW